MRRFAACCLALVALCAAGCEDKTRPDPDPIVEVTVAADGGYRLEGRPIGSDRLDRELARRARDADEPKLGRTKLLVHIRLEPGADYTRALALQERCQTMGIVQTEIQR